MGDPEIISAHIVELFGRYPQDRVDRAVVRLIEEHKFIPRISEIKETLDQETADLIRQQDRDRRVMLPAPPAPEKKPLDWTGLLTRLRTNEKTKPHWADVSANNLRGMAEFAATPDAPLRGGEKL